jgi:hypothetical protein
MESLNSLILGFTGLLLTTLVGLTVWCLKVIMDVRAGCGGCQQNIKHLGIRQDNLEKRQDIIEGTVGDLALDVGKIEQRVQTIEDSRG